jgi:hypothetical protein
MNQAILQVANAQNGINRLTNVHQSFLTHLGQGGGSTHFAGALSVADGVLSVDACGHSLMAVPRVVHHGGHDFAVEYTFAYMTKDVTTPIWRFYLTENGLLVSSLADDTSRLCDFNNQYVVERLLTEVSTAVLKSFLFAPSPAIDG